MTSIPHHKNPSLNATGYITACLLLLLLSASAHAVTLGQVDEFNGASTNGWAGNSVSGTNSVIPTGGPLGTGDGYLEITTLSFHVGTRNRDQWSGDYIDSGVGAIEMDLNHLNPGASPLRIRILLFGPGGTFATPSLTAPVSSNQWTRHTFPINADMIQVTNRNSAGTGNLDDTLANVTTLLIRHDRETPTPVGNHPPHITATLGIDNIRALPRNPMISDVERSGAETRLQLDDLIVGQSNVVQTTLNLQSDAWTNVAAFAATGTSTNLVVTNAAPQAFYRVELR